METVNILDARNNLSQLVAAAAGGEDVVIAKRGKPIVRLVAIGPSGDSAAEALARISALRATRAAHADSVSAADLDARIAGERAAWT